MASFPSYAKIHLAGFGEQRGVALLRTDMETGPPKQLKVKSRVLVARRATIRVNSKADYASFMTWFQTTINYGADWFTWADPVAGANVSARIVGGELGEAVPLGAIGDAWLIPCVIETWSA